LTFGKEFTQAVELKQVAQQDAERARFLVEKAEQQKKAAVISAEGDSQVSHPSRLLVLLHFYSVFSSQYCIR